MHIGRYTNIYQQKSRNSGLGSTNTDLDAKVTVGPEEITGGRGV